MSGDSRNVQYPKWDGKASTCPRYLDHVESLAVFHDCGDADLAALVGSRLVVHSGHDSSGSSENSTNVMKQLRQQPVNLRQTDNVEWQWIDSATGDLSAQGCDGAMYIPLLRQTVPRRVTTCGQSHYGVEPTNIPSAEDMPNDSNNDGNTNYIRESENQMDTDLSNHTSTRVISSGSYNGDN